MYFIVFPLLCLKIKKIFWAFGNHELCGDWCGYKKDPKSFSHKNLPGGKDLVRSGLQTFLTETLEGYACDDIAQKIAPLGSTQRNECLNGIIGSKNLKIRFYGGSESNDYRTATAIAQFNEGYSYLSMVTDKLNQQSNLYFLTKYTAKYNVKQHRQAMNQKTTCFEKNRKERRKQRKQNDQKKERMEGKTYKSGIGLNNEHTALVQSLLEEKDDPHPKLEQWRKACCLSTPNFVSLTREESVSFIFMKKKQEGLEKMLIFFNSHSLKLSSLKLLQITQKTHNCRSIFYQPKGSMHWLQR